MIFLEFTCVPMWEDVCLYWYISLLMWRSEGNHRCHLPGTGSIYLSFVVIKWCSYVTWSSLRQPGMKSVPWSYRHLPPYPYFSVVCNDGYQILNICKWNTSKWYHPTWSDFTPFYKKKQLLFKTFRGLIIRCQGKFYWKIHASFVIRGLYFKTNVSSSMFSQFPKEIRGTMEFCLVRLSLIVLSYLVLVLFIWTSPWVW